MGNFNKRTKYLIVVSVLVILMSFLLLQRNLALTSTLRGLVTSLARMFKVQQLFEQRRSVQGLEGLAPSSVEGWKTYRNEKYGFELRYPGYARIVEEGPYISQSGTQPSDNGSVAFYLAQDLKLLITMYSPGIVSGDYGWPERPCGEWSFSEDGEPESVEQATLAGYKTLRVVTVFASAPRQATVFYCVNHPKNPIVITFDELLRDRATQILSTFKFIK